MTIKSDLVPFSNFINTPPLWHGTAFGVTQFQFPVINLSRFTPQPISNTLRLGHQMEAIFKQLLVYDSPYKILISNLPIRAEKQTLGEIDFLLEHRLNKRLVHVELTYKFYILNTEITVPRLQLNGPNLKDAFAFKLEKIKNQQFPLIHTEASKKVLKNYGIDNSSINSEVCFKAQLFIPYGKKIALDSLFNTGCIAGYWLKILNFNEIDFGKPQYYIPNKKNWAIPPHNDVSWISYEYALKQIREQAMQERTPMVWLKNIEGLLKKFFIVWW